MANDKTKKDSTDSSSGKTSSKGKLIISLSAILVVLVAGIVTIYVMKMNSAKTQSTAAAPAKDTKIAQTEPKEMLPETKRELDEKEKRENLEKSTPIDPFGGPVNLVGIITSGSGSNLAIIETGSVSQVASAGDIIDDFWTVEKIDAETVLLKAGDRELQLTLPTAENSKDINVTNGGN